MNITSGRMTVGTVAVQIDGNSVNPTQLYVHNEDSTKSLFIGGEAVSTANGYAVDKSSTQTFTMWPNQSLWIVSESTGHVVSWLRIPI